LFSPSSVKNPHSLLLLKKITTCLLFILFAAHLQAQTQPPPYPLPIPYQTSSFVNYSRDYSILRDSSMFYPIRQGVIVIGRSTYAYNCHAFYTWECSPSSYAQNPEPNNARSALIAFNQLYYYTLTATASNACGSRRYPQSIYVTGYFSLSPNPASSNVTVTMLKGNNLGAGQMFTNNILSDSTVETMLIQPDPEVQTNIPVIYTVKIVNSFGSLLYSSKKSGDTFTIPVDNLSKGNYLVQISDGKTVSSQTLIISR
jgi:hypothetical protein